MKKLKKDTSKELIVLHSAVMAIEEILVKKNIVSVQELNEIIKKADKECRVAERKGKNILIS